MKIFIVGIGGYGNKYLEEVLLNGSEHTVEIAGCADPQPERCPLLDEIKQRNIPLAPSLADLYSQKLQADLVVMSPPIQLHAPLTELALQNNSAVLCEKPLCATLDEAETMANAQKKSGLPVAIGYQWSFADATQQIKHDILSGRFGPPLRAKCLVLWPRSAAYYSRNNWAGRITNDSGRAVYDSPVNNATSHFLHHMLYLFGSTPDSTAEPLQVSAECFRANPIENFDAAALRVKTATAEILFYTAHCVPDLLNPLMEIEFEKGTISFDYSDPEGFKAVMQDGTTKIYGCPDDTYWNKLWQTVDAVREGTPVLCGIPAATPHIRVVNTIQKESTVTDLSSFTRTKTWYDSAVLTYVPGVAEAFTTAYRNNTMPTAEDLPLT